MPMFLRIDETIRRSKAWDNPLFQEFRSPQLRWPGWPIARVVGPEYFYVTRTFPKILSILVARVDSEQLRAYLVRILYEELGSGDLKNAHFQLFRSVLEKAGADHIEGKRRQRKRETLALVDGLTKIYRDRELSVALGAQYALEFQAENMLSQLYEGFSKVIRDRRLEFFEVHWTQEVGHIQTMRECLTEAALDEDEAAILEGATECVELFGNFWAAFEPELLSEPMRPQS
jgi:pyrroloquinoline quinone (PQQ) biosynthesis protein C